MPVFFRQTEEIPFSGSPAYLDSRRTAFKNDQASGMIEVSITKNERIVILYARGIQAGIYRIRFDSRIKIMEPELSKDWGSTHGHIRSVYLPDVAARMLWLGLESHPYGFQEIADSIELIDYLHSSRVNRINSLVEIESEIYDGFIFTQNGSPVPGEMIFSTSERFIENLIEMGKELDNPITARLYDPDPASQSFRCTRLRLSFVEWGHHLLDHYSNLVGSRLLLTLASTMNILLKPWHWEIKLVNTAILDRHFFSSTDIAVQAYRFLFISLREQITRVLGYSLARRLAADAYGQLRPDDLLVLESKSLTPETIFR